MTYQDFLDTAPDAPVYFEPWYWQAMCGDNWDVIVIERGGKPAAALPYTIVKKKLWTILEKAPAGQFAGIWFAPEFRSQKLQYKLSEQIIEKLPAVDFFSQNFHYAFTNWLPFYWHNFGQSTRYTYLLENIRDTEGTFSNFCTDYRNNKIPKAQQQLTLKTDMPIEAFYELVTKTYERQGISCSVSLQQTQRLYTSAIKHDSGKLLMAVDDGGNPHAGLVLLWDKHTAYDWLAADDPALRGSGAGIWLVWEAIKFAANERGLNRFDFAGSMKQSIEKVRRNFGAQSQPYSYIYKYNSRLLEMLMKLRKGRSRV